jgi:hypothetical protein
LCFAGIKFPHCHNKLPLFELMAELKKSALSAFSAESTICHLQTAKKILPYLKKGEAAYVRKVGSCSRLYMASRQGFLAINANLQFHAP